jgi:hypothetical protein
MNHGIPSIMVMSQPTAVHPVMMMHAQKHGVAQRRRAAVGPVDVVVGVGLAPVWRTPSKWPGGYGKVS